MALKLFAKQSEVEVQTIDQDSRVARLEKHVEDMTMEMGKLKNEVDTMLARQQGFRLALRRLREYLEERGIQERTPTEIKDDQTTQTVTPAILSRKDKTGMH
ncbi:MAG: hypothetical protein H7249_03435 [Chitinophagaceae bacterium]|nr:hypothetical protein [Oligoflexus sp.]